MNYCTRRFRILAASLFLALLSACASVPMASLEQDARAKEFQVGAEQSRIYVYRNENFGGAIKMPVTLDGKMMGQTGPKTYFMWEVEPGVHSISCIGENVTSLELNARPGNSHFVWQEMKMGMWAAGCALHEVDATKGRAGVIETKLIQTQK